MKKTTAYARGGRRYIAMNPIQHAINRATKLTADEVRQILAPAREGLDALRIGRATSMDLTHLVTVSTVGISIEKKGVVKGLSEPLHEADMMIYDITKRATATGKWRSPTLYASEIIALTDLLHLHEFQLQQLSFAEHQSAHAHAVADARRRGAAVVELREIEAA